MWIICVSCSCYKQYHKNVSDDCIYNFFLNGTVCQECPAWYFGKNCSMQCIPPDYGCSCTQQCSCPVCHHILGCIFTTKSVSTDLEYKKEGNAEPQGTSCTNSQSVSTNLIIILTGVVITLSIFSQY
uniref:Uncharacterized protein n=1 Tax=Magallana gigas TaxID=29159 RepID=A0A8W8LX44_MAGGI